MRLWHRDGQTVHLAYGTNVRHARDLRGILAQLDSDAVRVREALNLDLLDLGLWLAAPVASALASSYSLRVRLRSELAARGLEVVTVNGFPYRDPSPTASSTRGSGAVAPPSPGGRGTHAEEPAVAGSSRTLTAAKQAIYRPDWTERDRLQYTLDLARVLCDLMPDDAERGSVSTLPIAWREPWDADRADRADRMLEDLADGLAEITWHTGRLVRVGFEPEPGCLIETTAQAVEHLSDIDPNFLGICLDLAHLPACGSRPRPPSTCCAPTASRSSRSSSPRPSWPTTPTRPALPSMGTPNHASPTRRVRRPEPGSTTCPRRWKATSSGRGVSTSTYRCIPNRRHR